MLTLKTEITIRNKLTNNNGTSIHWHGVRQLNTNWFDGVSGVTECPIPVRLATIILLFVPLLNNFSLERNSHMSGMQRNMGLHGIIVSIQWYAGLFESKVLNKARPFQSSMLVYLYLFVSAWQK